MSPIGRLFIVLNLLLAGIFLGYAAFYLQNHDTYRKKFEEEAANHAKTRETLGNEKSQLEQRVSSLTSDLQSVNGNLENERTQRKAAEDENTNLKSRLDDLQGKLANIEGSMSTMGTTVDNQNVRIKELTEGWIAAKDAQSKAETARDDAIDKQMIAESQLRKSQERIDSLTAEIGEKSTENRKLRTELDVILAEIPDARAIATRALPAVEGTVMDVNAELRTVSISLGENQADVKKGWNFSVHDGTTYKGEIRITDVSSNMAYGRIEQTVPGTTIRKGDKATTRLAGN